MTIILHRGYLPGAIGTIAALHGTYYAQHWGLGAFFEAKVARDLAAFVLEADPARDGLWLALADERIVGSVAIDGAAAATDEALANQHFETIEALVDAQVERCQTVQGMPETIRSRTNYHWWPELAASC